MRVVVLALDNLFDTGLSVFLDAFVTANALSAKLLGGSPRFEVTVVGTRKKVTSGLGFTIPVKPVTADLKPDWVVVPALKSTTPETLGAALERPDVRRAIEHLRAWRVGGARIAAACIGTYLVAEAGLLDGHEATSTWSLSPFFRQRYPKVLLDESRMIVPSEIGVTAGAAMGHLDLVLWLIRKASPELGKLVSRYLLADVRPLQATYIIPQHLAQADPLILRFERWARENLARGFDLQEVATQLATSPRSLQRRCQAVLGKSPLAYFQDLRVERARALIQGSGLGLEAIAAEVGYVDGATLRTLLRQRLGRGVRELRAEMN